MAHSLLWQKTQSAPDREVKCHYLALTHVCFCNVCLHWSNWNIGMLSVWQVDVFLSEWKKMNEWPSSFCQFHCGMKTAGCILKAWATPFLERLLKIPLSFVSYCLLLSQLPAICPIVWTIPKSVFTLQMSWTMVRTETSSLIETKIWTRGPDFGPRNLSHLLFSSGLKRPKIWIKQGRCESALKWLLLFERKNAVNQLLTCLCIFPEWLQSKNMHKNKSENTSVMYTKNPLSNLL